MHPFLAIATVAVGGAVGSVARYLVSNWFAAALGPGFPWGTFTINVSGSFIIGIVLQLAATKAGFSPYLRVFLATGIMGGYTTFSTYAFDTYTLANQGLYTRALAYGVGSFVIGSAAASLAALGIRTFF